MKTFQDGNQSIRLYIMISLQKRHDCLSERLTFFPAMGSTKSETKHSPRLQGNTQTQTNCYNPPPTLGLITKIKLREVACTYKILGEPGVGKPGVGKPCVGVPGVGENGVGEPGVVVGEGRTSFFYLNLKNQIKVIENLKIFCYCTVIKNFEIYK